MNEPKVTLPEPPAGNQWEYRGEEWRNDRATFCYLTTVGRLVVFPDAPAVGAAGHYWEAVPKLTTVKQWLETLPDGYRERALANHAKSEVVNAGSLRKAIDSFEWHTSSERYTFWLAVYDWSKDPDTRTLPPLAGVPVSELQHRGYFERVNAELNKENCSIRLQCDELNKEIDRLRNQRDELNKQVEAPEPDHTEGGKYQMLKSGVSVIEEGDEVLTVNGWTKYSQVAFGETVRPKKEARRPIDYAKRVELPEPDHTEGGRYQMLKGGVSVIEEGDEVLCVSGWRNYSQQVFGKTMNPDLEARRPIDYAKRAKAILQSKLGPGSPFSDTALDEFVDLIIKAAKQ